jgi:hypothetical protein
MAFFAVGLMVAFLIPSGLQRLNNRQSQARAKMGDQTLTYGDFDRASVDWRILRENVHTYSPFGGQPIPLLYSLGNPSPQRLAIITGHVPSYQFQNAPVAPVEIVGNPLTFLLLLKEAQTAGIVISDQRLDGEMADRVSAPPSADPAADARIREAVRDFMMVQASYERIASQVKTSDPMLQRAMAERFVRLSADLSVFDGAASSYPSTSQPATAGTTQPATRSAIPSPADLKAQFEKYSTTPPNHPTRDNPFGFGYRIPDRVKVQTISVTRDQLKAVIEKTRTPDKWDVAARTYFYTHKDEFPASQPTSMPSLNAGYDLSAMPTSQPGKRKFDSLTAEQKKESLDKAMEPEIAALSGRIVAFLNDRFTADYTKSKPATTQPITTQPTTGYLSYSYLEQIAASVQKQFNILPTVEDHAQWLDQETASSLPGLGQALSSDRASFATLAMGAQPFHQGHDDDEGLALYQFSSPLRDFNDNLYLFRITAAQVNHTPTSMDEVLPQLLIDVQKQRATDTATQQAKLLLDTAVKDGFAAAAHAAGKSVLPVGPIDLQTAAYGSIPGFEVAPADRLPFLRGLGNLLSSPMRDSQNHPLGTILLPNSEQVLAVNITAAPIQTSFNREFTDELSVRVISTIDMASAIQRAWFSFEGVSKRVDYVGERPDQRAE